MSANSDNTLIHLLVNPGVGLVCAGGVSTMYRNRLLGLRFRHLVGGESSVGCGPILPLYLWDQLKLMSLEVI